MTFGTPFSPKRRDLNKIISVLTVHVQIHNTRVAEQVDLNVNVFKNINVKSVKLHSAVISRWNHVTTNDLSNEARDNLCKNIMFPINCEIMHNGTSS